MKSLNDILNDMNIVMEADSHINVEFKDSGEFDLVSREEDFYALTGAAYLDDKEYKIQEGVFSCIDYFYEIVEEVYNKSSTEKEFFEKLVEEGVLYD